ncbi:IS110 family transposase [Marinobacter sp. CA1]|uniref:IS110 family transposase n=1 Tax=Marinobacter sp. CA1 TaxID=2817656 RepID=UPI001D073BED|nr:IS110 family transposase [Marinobacter sp. CA1]
MPASQFLAYIGDIRRFKNAKVLAAFVGVTPRQKQSGTSVKDGAVCRGRVTQPPGRPCSCQAWRLSATIR